MPRNVYVVTTSQEGLLGAYTTCRRAIEAAARWVEDASSGMAMVEGARRSFRPLNVKSAIRAVRAGTQLEVGTGEPEDEILAYVEMAVLNRHRY